MHDWKWIDSLEQCFQSAIDWIWGIVRLYLTNIGELFSSQGRMDAAFVVTLIFVLVLGWTDIKRKWQGVSGKAALSGFLEALLQIRFVAFVFAAYVAALYVPGQSLSLGRSLATAFFLSQDKGKYGAGFEASGSDATSWVIANLYLMVLTWFYLRAQDEKAHTPQDTKARGHRPEFWTALITSILLVSVINGTLLAPMLTSPMFPFSIKIAAFWLAASLIPLLRAVLFPGLKWLAIAFVFNLLLMVLALAGHEAWALAGVLLAAVPTGIRVAKHENAPIVPAFGASFDVTGALAVVVLGAALRGSLLAHGAPEISIRVLMVALVWLLPSMLMGVMLKVRFEPVTGVRGLNIRWILATFVPGFVLLVWNIERVIALVVLPALACLAISVGLVAEHRRVRRWRGILLLVGLSLISWGIYQLAPTLDLSKELQGPPRLAEMPKSELKTRFQDWLDARHDKSTEAPIVLVAAAGGGIRAAAHVALTLAVVDENTNGWFRDRVFAISGVSGGSLGTLLWTSAVDQRVFADAQASVLVSQRPWLTKMSHYFDEDFVSPSATRLLLRDMTIGALIPGVEPSRDGALTQAWSNRWRDMSAKAVDTPETTRFEAFLNARPRDAVAPLLIFNSTSAADGKRAVATSFPVNFAGARVLDPNIRAVDAVLNSARFPIVSAVADVCANSPVAGLRVNSKIHCANGWEPVTVTDGGYADNSGLESVQEILAQLKEIDKNQFANVYVVYISSDPNENLPFIDGQRFNPGSFIATLTSPFEMMEEARAGRARAISDSVQRSLPAGHFVRWGLSSRTYYDSLLAGIPETLPLSEQERRMQTMLRSPPLGWTLDPVTAPEINVFALSHGSVFLSDTCGPESEPGRALCNAYRRWEQQPIAVTRATAKRGVGEKPAVGS